MADGAAPAAGGVEKYRAAGAAAIKEGRLADALKQYSDGLQVEPESHVLLGNRAIVNLRLRNLEAAVDDATDAILLKKDHVKAHSTKAAALHQLGRYEECLRACEAGLAVQPGHSNLKATQRAAQAAQWATAERGAESSAPPPAASGSGLSLPTSPLQLIATTAAAVDTSLGAARIALLLLIIAYMVGGLVLSAQFASSSYYRALVVAGGLQLVHLLREHGRPQFTAEWGLKLVQSPALNVLFIALTFYSARPTLMVLVPVCIFELVHMTVFVYQLAYSLSPAAAGSLCKLADQIGGRVTGREDWPSLGYSQRMAVVGPAASQLAARLQVALGFMLVLELATPARSVMALVMHWQGLRLQFVLNYYVKRAFQDLDGFIEGMLSASWVPAAVRGYYVQLRDFIHRQASPPNPEEAQAQAQAQAGGGGLAGMMKGCTVM